MRFLQTAVLSLVAVSNLGLAQGQQPPSAAKSLSAEFNYVHRQILDMARDFPEEKYGFKLKPEMRSFGEVIVHVASGVVYAAKAGVGEKVKWDELDPKNYPNKSAIVALLEKTVADAQAAMKQNPEGPNKNLQPFLSVLEHSAEHYGLLVAYYRANGLVPPASRPKK
jgi:DinB superfamily